MAGNLPYRPGVVRLITSTSDRRPAAVPPEALFVVSAIAQYVGAVIAVNLFDQVDPVTVAWFRVLGAAVALVAVSLPRLRRGGRWTRAELRAAAVFGVATALMNTFFYLGIDRLPLGTGVTIEFIGPIAVAAARTRTTRNAIALGLAAVGVVVLSGLEIGDEPLGLLFILAASAMWAAYIVIGAKVARLDRGVAGLGVGLGFAVVMLAPVGVPGSGEVWTTASLLVACAAVGLFSSAIGYGIDQHVLRRIPVRRFSLLLALLPVTAAVVGFIGLDQTPSAGDLVGMSLVLAGVVVQSREVL